MKKQGNKKDNSQVAKIRTIIGTKAKGQRVKDITITEFSKTILNMCLELKSGDTSIDVDEKYFEIVDFMNKHNIHKSSAWDIIDEMIIQFDLPARDKEKSKRSKPKQKDDDKDTRTDTSSDTSGQDGSGQDDKDTSDDKDKKKNPDDKKKEPEQISKIEAEIRTIFGNVLKGIKIKSVTKLSKELATACLDIKDGKVSDVNEKYFEIVEIIKGHKVTADLAWKLVDEMIKEFGLPERDKTKKDTRDESGNDDQTGREDDSDEEENSGDNREDEEEEIEIIVPPITSGGREDNHSEEERERTRHVDVKVSKSKADLTSLEKFLRGEYVGEEILKDLSKLGKDEAKIFKLLAKTTGNFYSKWGRQYKVLGIVGATLATGITGTALVGAAGVRFAYTGAQTITRGLFAAKGTAQRAYKKHQIEVMRKNIECLNEFAPELVDLLEDNATECAVPEEVYDRLSDEDKKIIDTVRDANESNNEKKISKKYDLLNKRSQLEMDDIRLSLLKNAHPEVYRVYEAIASKKYSSGRQKYKMSDIYDFLSKTQLETVTEKDADGNDIETKKLSIPDDIKLNARGLKEDFLELVSAGITEEDIKNAIKIFQENDFLNITDEEVIHSLETYGDPEADDLIEKHNITIQMQTEVAAKFKYQLALELQSQVKNMEARMHEYIEKEETHILTSEAEREYKRLRQLAQEKVEQLSTQGLAEIEEKGERKYAKVCDSARDLLGTPLESVEPLRTAAEKDKKAIKDVTGRD